MTTSIRNILLNGTFFGTVETSPKGKNTKYLGKDSYLLVEDDGKEFKIPLRGFGDSVIGLESLHEQKVLIGAEYALEESQDKSKVFGNVRVLSCMAGALTDRNDFALSGFVESVEEKGKLKIVTLVVDGEYYDNASKTRKVVERATQVAFFGDSKALTEQIVRGQAVLIEGRLRSSGEKNYLDFIGDRVTVMADTDGAAVDTAGI